MPSETLEELLPLKPVILQILLALAEKESHGYGLISVLQDRSSGRIRLDTGPLYRHLKRLIDDGLVEAVEPEGRADDPRRGARYRLTPLGRRVVGAESRRLAEVVSLTRELGLLPGEGAA